MSGLKTAHQGTLEEFGLVDEVGNPLTSSGGLIPTHADAATTLFAGRLYTIQLPAADTEYILPTFSSGSQMICHIRGNKTNNFRAIFKTAGGQLINYNGAEGDEIRVDDCETWIGFVYDSDASRIIAYDAKVPLSGTFGGDLEVTGDFTPSGGIVGKTDGVAVAAGYVGEILGTKKTGGTNGNVYYDESTATITTTAAITVSRTVNKGNYLGTFFLMTAKKSNTSIERGTFTINIGGANSGSSFTAPIVNVADEYTSVSATLPLEITADGVVVGMECKMLTEDSRLAWSRMSLIRIS